MRALLTILVILLLFSGCAATATATFTDTKTGIKTEIVIDCSRMSSCESNKGDQGIKVDGKINPFKGLINNF